MVRSVNDLESNAEKFWPTELARREAKTTIIPKLIASQEKFIGLLYVADSSPEVWKSVLAATSGMPANLFLKHLAVMADVGGEALQRVRANIKSLFPLGVMTYFWKGRSYTYTFQSLPSVPQWTNPRLGISGRGLSVDRPMSPVIEDVAMLLMHASASTDSGIPGQLAEKCLIGSLLGQKVELDAFVRQRYIHVSRITGGATANAMGQLCQSFVREQLQSELPTWSFARSTIPGLSQNAGRTDISFDVVAESPTGVCCAIEVSFQVTTNSTIERKAGQALARQKLLHDAGHRIAYVIDGAGNFERRSAITTICEHSDCTVTLKTHELQRLAKFLQGLGKRQRGQSAK